MGKSHIITVICEGQQIGDWLSGNIESSLITPGDRFTLRRPLALDAWNALRRDAHVVIQADGTTLLDGYIDKRDADARGDVMEISGRDRVGRLIDESAPAIDYSGLTILKAVQLLADSQFGTVSINGARNRRVRRGRGRRAASGNEPVVTFNVKVPRRGQVHPGETRWQLIHEIVSRAGLICYSSSDGKELIVGKPNQSQEPQYLFAFGKPGSRIKTTVRDLKIVEDDGDRFSLYMCAGVGGQSDTNYGKNVTDNRGVSLDNPFNKLDGTGRDFIHPKRMFLPERAFSSFQDAQQVADNERDRRDFKRHIAMIEMPAFGQFLGTSDATLFAPDTVARVIFEKLEIDDRYLVVSCSYTFARDTADTTVIHAVPSSTKIIL